jgi:cold shock CspA family protein
MANDSFMAKDQLLNNIKDSEQISKLLNQHKHEIIELDEDRPTIGKYMGYCKWFNNDRGYGFIRVISEDLEGYDIFVHYTGLNPLNSSFKTLCKGEYIQFNVIDGKLGKQAIDTTGIKGGPLMCDNLGSA